MITLTLYCDDYRYSDRKVTLDPLDVESIREGERRPMDSGTQQVAYLTMKSGEKFIVVDGSRLVATRIAAACHGARSDAGS